MRKMTCWLTGHNWSPWSCERGPYGTITGDGRICNRCFKWEKRPHKYVGNFQEYTDYEQNLQAKGDAK